MRSDRSGERLACPHCHANNFVGQAQCWQCHGSLPPPEEMKLKELPPASRQANTNRTMGGANEHNYSAPNALNPAPVGQYVLPVAPRSHSKTPLILCIALLTASALIWIGTRHTSVTTGTSAHESAEMKSLRAEGQGVVSESELSNSGLPDSRGARLAVPPRDAQSTSTDPAEIAAKRAIEQALPQLGLPPGSASDGKVHLRNGDTISREQYEDVQRKLRQNPALGAHTPVPRL